MRRAIALVPAAWLVALGCASAPPAAIPPVASDGRPVMGTVLEIELHGLERDVAGEALDDLFAVAERLDGLLSVYRSGSAINRLNDAAGRGPLRVEPAVAEILRLSVAYSELTEGAFDVTVGPLIELWMRAAERDAPPTSAELASARELVGSKRIHIGTDGSVALEREGVAVDLGGVAKGYALDRMLPLLEERGVTDALLSFGQSSTWALGAPPGSDGWRLLVRGLDGGFAGLITLRDQALSVSASLGEWVEIGGTRYGHILDPRRGEPLMRPRQAVVVGPRAVLAEALSVAMLILEAGRGLALVAAQPGCEALLIEADGELLATPGWADAVRFETIPAGD